MRFGRLAALAMAGFLLGAAGCGEKEEPSPTAEPPAERSPAQEVLAAGPPAIRTLSPVPSCGVQEARLGLGPGRSRGEQERRCLGKAWREGEPAELLIESGTIEGDPINIVHRVREGGQVLVVTDASKDRYGGRGSGWITRNCLQIEFRQLATERCSTPIRVDAKTPTEVVSRATLPSCGRERERPRARPVGARARACFERRLASREPFEFVSVERRPSGSVTRYIRSAPRQDDYEIISDSTDAGAGWTLDRCVTLKPSRPVTFTDCDHTSQLYAE